MSFRSNLAVAAALAAFAKMPPEDQAKVRASVPSVDEKLRKMQAEPPRIEQPVMKVGRTYAQPSVDPFAANLAARRAKNKVARKTRRRNRHS